MDVTQALTVGQIQNKKLPLSGAAIWVVCTGWLRLSRAFRDEETKRSYADEGDAAHELAQRLIDHPIPEAQKIVATAAKNGHFFDNEMYEAAWIFRDAVRAAGGKPNTEWQIHAEKIHRNAYGTVDCWTYNEETNTLHVFDYKYGHGLVEVENNWQLIAYAIGLLCTEMKSRGVRPKVSLYIVQPRPWHGDGSVRRWDVPHDVLARGFKTLTEGALATFSEGSVTASGPHCKYCDALKVCPAARRAALTAVDFIDTVEAEHLTADAMGAEAKLLEQAAEAVKNRLTGLKTEIETLIHKRKTKVRHWEVKQAPGHVKWDKKTPVKDLIARAALAGVDIVNREKGENIITAVQARKQFEKIAPGTFSNLTFKYAPQPKLVLKKET